ncbi:hypothetical protein [Phascolarctobacterium sp.]|uniref:hypothetical protein n=1 Tax=Phascolarctobacterium sp. TaxID=2049039 RepID=UPI00304F1364
MLGVLSIISIVMNIMFVWLVLVMIKPSKFFFFIKPESKWKRLKAIGVFLAVYFIGLLLIYMTNPAFFTSYF